VNELLELIIAKANYWMTIALMMVGLYAMITKKNLVKKIIGMNILQTAVILLFISIGAKKGATIPIILHETGAQDHGVHSTDYINPLPHVLMLTAIVVAVSTLGVALALAIKIYRQYQTLDEDEILMWLQEESSGGDQ
jgi:multicomponent Na+:H+ antiporter subunit C